MKRCVPLLLFLAFAVVSAALSADAHTLQLKRYRSDDPLNPRFAVRGVDPHDYLGYFGFRERVEAAVLRNEFSLPDRKPEGPEITSFVVRLTGDLYWDVRLLSVKIVPGDEDTDAVEAHLKWPGDTRALNDPSFKLIRKAFARSKLQANAPEWIAERDRLLPDPESVARKIVVIDSRLDMARCPQFLADLQHIRDEPPRLLLIPDQARIGEHAPFRPIPVTVGGREISVVWQGVSGWSGGGRASPDEISEELGRDLVQLIYDASGCSPRFMNGAE